MNVWRVCMLFIWIFFCFQASAALCIFMSTYANSWIKAAARQNTIWIRFGNRRAIRRRVEPGMALTAIGEVTQWGGVADLGRLPNSQINNRYIYPRWLGSGGRCLAEVWLNVRQRMTSFTLSSTGTSYPTSGRVRTQPPLRGTIFNDLPGLQRLIRQVFAQTDFLPYWQV
jgi:hypothetical protein